MLSYLAKYSTYKCRVWALIDSADTATHLSSFRALAYLVTRSNGGKILDSFSINVLTNSPTSPKLRHQGCSSKR